MNVRNDHDSFHFTHFNFALKITELSVRFRIQQAFEGEYLLSYEYNLQ